VSGSLVSPETRAKVRGLMTPVAVGLGKLGLTPNALTVIGFGIACVAALLAGWQQWLAAGLLVVFGGVFDLFDGALARATNRVSNLGAFMDSVFDRWGEGVVYVGIIAGSLAGGFAAGAILGGAAMTSAFMVSYTRAKSESLGFTPGSGMANVGLAPREVRIAILTVGLVLTGWMGGVLLDDGGQMVLLDAWSAGRWPLAITLGLITILATLTTIQRIVHTIRQSQQQQG
jgi:phosphatidylglycerophosphate synthase